MSDSIANATGKGPVIFLEKDGKTYTLAPVQMKELGDIEILAKKMHRLDVRAYLQEMGDLLSEDERKEIMQDLRAEVAGGPKAVDSKSDWTWMSEIQSPVIMAEIIIYRLRKAHPELSQEEASEMVTLDAIANVEAEMTELLGIDAFGSGDDTEPGEATSG